MRSGWLTVSISESSYAVAQAIETNGKGRQGYCHLTDARVLIPGTAMWMEMTRSIEPGCGLEAVELPSDLLVSMSTLVFSGSLSVAFSPKSVLLLHTVPRWHV